jgi:hypothetical protein
MNKRDNFPSEVIRLTKIKAAYICSNPKCRILTIAPSLNDDMEIQYCGKVAHISAASAKGPRYEKGMTIEERKSISNAIFLCSNCADLIDKNDGNDYEIAELKKWKEIHQNWVIENLNKSIANNQVLVSSKSQSGGITANTVTIVNPNPEKVDKNIQTDTNTFLESESIFNENHLLNLCSDLLSNAECDVEDSENLEKVYLFFKKSSSTFLSNKLEVLKKKYVISAENLYNFIRGYFDKWPYEQRNDNYNIRLQPHFISHNGYVEPTDETRVEWDKLFEKLQTLATNTKDSYDNLRKQIKKELHI